MFAFLDIYDCHIEENISYNFHEVYISESTTNKINGKIGNILRADNKPYKKKQRKQSGSQELQRNCG